MSTDRMEKIISLAKRRGFVFPGSEIYGGLANSWDYGPLGVELKNNIKNLWWNRFVRRRDDVVGIDAALIMNPKVWEASGHVAGFSDPLVECKKCHSRYRADQLEGACANCGGKQFTEAKNFNLMLKTFLGPAEEKANEVYFRPETAQAMFVNFKSVQQTSRKILSFGIAQIGKAFRNEITPGNFIFRTREFEQMEIEYFCREGEWETNFEHWRMQMLEWMRDDLGLTVSFDGGGKIDDEASHVHELEVPDGERAHYSKRTIDFEFDFPFGRKELYGLAYRGDFDLRNHFRDDAPYHDEVSGEAFYPHVVEPTWGVDRSVLAVLSDAYDDSDPEHVILKLKPKLAPFVAAVFPLLKNKPELVRLAREVYDGLKERFSVTWDDRGNIGKRYYSQDEIGTPVCITVDFDSLGEEKPEFKDTVTIRHRDTGKQERKPISELSTYLTNLIAS